MKHIKNDQLPPLETLITRAEAKYQDFMKSGEWTAIPKDEQLLALQVKIASVEKKNQKLTAKKSRKKNDSSSKRGDKRPKSASKRRGGKMDLTGDDKWMLIPPKKGKEEESKEHDGKKWSWCKHHEKWVLLNGRFGKHTSELCSLNPKNKDKKKKAAKDGE